MMLQRVGVWQHGGWTRSMAVGVGPCHTLAHALVRTQAHEQLMRERSEHNINAPQVPILLVA